MGHNFISHALLAIGLFVLNSLIFGGAGTLSAMLMATVGLSGVFLVSGQGGLNQALTGAEAILAVLITIIVNIVIYYGLAAIIIFIFNLFFGKK